MQQIDYERFPFPHTKLDAFRVARELACVAKEAADSIPYGYRKYRDQLLRSGGAPALLICEGANRYHKGAKRQRYDQARGEAGEAAGTTVVLNDMGLISSDAAANINRLAGRLGAMLTGLIRSCT